MTIISPIVALPHQSEARRALKTAREEAKKTGLVVMASGLGKTILAALDVQEWFTDNSESRCLFLCHQNHILEQAQPEFEKVLGDSIPYGFFHGTEKSADNARVVFASFQTMCNRLEEFDPQEFDYIVVDENHRSHAPTHKKVIDYFKPRFLLGLTATPDRMDGLDIREIYGEPVYTLSLVDALVRGLLSPIEYKLMTDEISSLKMLDTPQGKLSVKLLNRLVFVPKRDEEIAAIIKRHMDQIQNPKAIVFCSSIEHCERMAKVIPGSVPLHSGVSTNDLKMRLELFKQGVFQVAVTVDMFNEALDIPQANIIVFLRSTESPIIYFQQLGRGLRISEGKEKVVVLDFAGNCERVSFVYELWQKVRSVRQGFVRSGDCLSDVDLEDVKREPFSLNVDAVDFKERIIPLIELIGRLKPELYQTWQEASLVVRSYEFPGRREYKRKYKEIDSKLPRHPERYYSDFPSWPLFLRGGDESFYETWSQAQKATKKLGIKSCIGYLKGEYKKDPRLPSAPEQFYSDWPGWTQFLENPGRKSYDTCKQAMDSAKRFNFVNQIDYQSRCKSCDPLLPVGAPAKYHDFPGWPEFLGKERKRGRPKVPSKE